MALKANNVLIKSIEANNNTTVGTAKPITWKTSWSQPFVGYGDYVWTDGIDTYYSRAAAQYILNKSTSTWNAKTWNGFTSIAGDRIWTDGTDIYYSNGIEQYILNKSTSTWSEKTWNGLTSFVGDRIWTDGTDIYYSNNRTQYILNKSTSIWSEKTWNGLTYFDAVYIWTDGTNIYYSSDTSQYQLDKTTSTWSVKTWTGLTSFRGWYIWTDGTNIFCSNDQNQYQLNKSTSTWEPQIWNGLTNFLGQRVWTDGTNFYYSKEDDQYQLYPPTPIQYLYKGDTCQWVKPYTITIKVTGAPNANIKVIIYRSSNAKGQEPSAVYDSSGGESSYVLNVASTSADGQQIVGYYGDTLYVKAQSYSSGSYRYNISGQSYTVTGDGQITVNVSHSATCSSCNTSALKNICNTRCNTNLKHIGVCGDTSKTSGMCMV